jgi:hypothetical protein
MKNSIPTCLPLGMFRVSKGIFIRTYDNGNTFWYARWVENGKAHMKKLGVYPDITEKQAKLILAKHKKDIIKNNISAPTIPANYDIELENAVLESHPRPMCGVYLLIDGADVVYVGQSINLLSRLGKHAYDKNFTHYKVIECHLDELDKLEAHYIYKFKPKYNRVREDGSIVTNLKYKVSICC